MALKDRLAAIPVAAPEHHGENTVAQFRRKLLAEVDLAELRKLSPSHLRARLEKVVGHLVTREGPVLSNAQRAALIRQVVDEALGLGVLEPLLADPTVTEIMVNGHDDVWVERSGRLEQVPGAF